MVGHGPTLRFLRHPPKGEGAKQGSSGELIEFPPNHNGESNVYYTW
jgi:hypothetical protein